MEPAAGPFKDGAEKLSKTVANLQMPPLLLKEVDQLAQERMLSRSDVLRAAIRAGLPIVRKGA